MANTSAAKKAIRVQEHRRRHNVAVRSKVKTVQKEALAQMESKAPDAQTAVIRAISQIDKALAKGILHRNNAARKKSRLMRKLNLLGLRT